MELTSFNPVDILHNDDEILQHLRDAYSLHGPEFFVKVLGSVVKKKGVAEVATLAGVSRESLYKVFKDGAQPQFLTIVKIVNALGLKIEIAA